MTERKLPVCISMIVVVPFVVVLIACHLAFGTPHNNCQWGQNQPRDNACHFNLTDGFIYLLHVTYIVGLLAYTRLFT